MKKGIARKIVGTLFIIISVFIAFYAGGWMFFIKGFFDLLSSYYSLRKIIIGLLKIVIGFPMMEVIAYFLWIIGIVLVKAKH